MHNWDSIPLGTLSGPSEELCKISLRIVLCVGRGAGGRGGLGHLSAESYPSAAEDYSWECFTYLFLLPGCVNIFGLQKTLEAEEQEPLSLALEVRLVVVHRAAHHSCAGKRSEPKGCDTEHTNHWL